jgi:hypothetical protein
MIRCTTLIRKAHGFSSFQVRDQRVRYPSLLTVAAGPAY